MIEPRKFLPLLAAAGLLISFHQLLDLVPQLAGVDLSIPTSRVRLVLMLWSRSSALIVADIFLIAAAIGLQQARALVALARVHLVSGVLLLLAVPFLLVSAGAMASTIGGTGAGIFRVTMARTLLGLTLAGTGALLAWREIPGTRKPLRS